MKSASSPRFWLLFGVFGFPIVCFIGEIMGITALELLGLMPKSGIPDFGWGGLPGLFLGLPLGIVSALSAYGWQNQRFYPARCMAVLGGVAMGDLWWAWATPNFLAGYIGDFGFVATPFIWCAALILWGFLARSPKL